MHVDPKTSSRLRPFHAPGPWNAYGNTSTRIYCETRFAWGKLVMARDDMRASGQRFFVPLKFDRDCDC
ncbi:hypothetical protein BELL_0281g00080 [Botrytis elliptica]|uniref:Uncharacterized protein n=1 Tax=Botrytis elliptica TaxID=278938 RepID=A0A4Z1JLV6_9HELO|nr:hypothetical protein BELL_0281g00080 [Botrytis elliptica]